MDFIFSADGLKILALLVVVITVVWVKQRRQHRLAGDPKVVKDQLERLGADYTVLSNVVVSAERGMNDVSHVVVSAYGVFVLTIKTEAGKVFGREGDRGQEHGSYIGSPEPARVVCSPERVSKGGKCGESPR